MSWFLAKPTLHLHLPYYGYTLPSICGVYVFKVSNKESYVEQHNGMLKIEHIIIYSMKMVGGRST